MYSLADHVRIKRKVLGTQRSCSKLSYPGSGAAWTIQGDFRGMAVLSCTFIIRLLSIVHVWDHWRPLLGFTRLQRECRSAADSQLEGEPDTPSVSIATKNDHFELWATKGSMMEGRSEDGTLRRARDLVCLCLTAVLKMFDNRT